MRWIDCVGHGEKVVRKFLLARGFRMRRVLGARSVYEHRNGRTVSIGHSSIQNSGYALSSAPVDRISFSDSDKVIRDLCAIIDNKNKGAFA